MRGLAALRTLAAVACVGGARSSVLVDDLPGIETTWGEELSAAAVQLQQQEGVPGSSAEPSAPPRRLPSWMALGNGKWRKGDMPPVCSLAIPIVDQVERVALCMAPKVGSLAWRRLFLRMYQTRLNYTYAENEGDYWTHAGNYCQTQKTLDTTLTMSEDPDENVQLATAAFFGSSDGRTKPYTRIMIKRNPMTRYLSSYLHHMAVARENANCVNEAARFMNYTGGAVADLTFSDFAKHYLRDNTCEPARMDTHLEGQHWYPQHCRCGLAQGVPYNIQARLEDMADAVTKVRLRTCVCTGGRRVCSVLQNLHSLPRRLLVRSLSFPAVVSTDQGLVAALRRAGLLRLGLGEQRLLRDGARALARLVRAPGALRALRQRGLGHGQGKEQ
jgi:hypothetical protein